MTDTLQTPGPLDHSRINLAETEERRYWAEKFGVTEERLRETVQQVGAAAEAVRSELEK
ncbi:MAG TPA: DUF3606 domain-containing protein [Burkholderiales bacterium]|jgi:hypothetical protein|nr:DUF3606 domain-containing protein [Burkholderiales bacterium]